MIDIKERLRNMLPPSILAQEAADLIDELEKKVDRTFSRNSKSGLSIDDYILELKGEIEELEALLSRLSTDHTGKDWQATVDEAVAAEQERLKPWLYHHDRCEQSARGRSPLNTNGTLCTCGLATAIREQADE